MVESVSQWDFYKNQGMHYMAFQATTGDTDEELFHNAHLQLQDHTRNPILFHAEIMVGIMHLCRVKGLAPQDRVSHRNLCEVMVSKAKVKVTSFEKLKL